MELAKQHDKASEVEKVQRYQMPSEKGELNSYLEEDTKEKVRGYHGEGKRMSRRRYKGTKEKVRAYQGEGMRIQKRRYEDTKEKV